jgi:hypothetical protein
MAVRSREELMTSLNTILGDRNDDDALNFIQDVSDTYDDLSSHTGTYTEEQYTALDNQWRQRYRERFFNTSSEEADEDFKPLTQTQNKPAREETITIKDLFTPVNN